MKILLIFIFFFGLGHDLSVGSNLGQTSLFYLLVLGLFGFFISKLRLPIIKL